MSNNPNKLASKHTPGPWEVDNFIPHWIKGKKNVGDICMISNHSWYDKLQGADLANAHIISAAPEAIEFIADLLDTIRGNRDFNSPISKTTMEIFYNRGEEILKKAYNL
jgi:hypothetical protein